MDINETNVYTYTTIHLKKQIIFFYAMHIAPVAKRLRRPPSKRKIVGSIPTGGLLRPEIAQLAELSIVVGFSFRNVPGSNPGFRIFFLFTEKCSIFSAFYSCSFMFHTFRNFNYSTICYI